MKNNTHELDLIGLKCPLPVLRANKKLKEFSKNEVVKILVDDPSAPEDFRILCKTKKYKLISSEKKTNYINITIKI